MRTKGSWGTVLPSSWLAAVLAGALAVTTPVAATVVGERTATEAAGSPGARLDPVRAAGGEVIGGGPRSPTPPADVVPATRVLAEHATLAPPRAPRPETEATGATGYDVVLVEPGLVARANPWPGARAIARVPVTSRYYQTPLRLWIEEVRARGAWGLVELPYAWPHREGWIRLEGVRVRHGDVLVRVDLSEHRVRVYRHERLVRTFPGATGAPASPTPPGDYVVTDRVAFTPGSSLGSFAFGISGIQPRLPAGWNGGDQLAIHGTNAPSTIGTSASAGCIRVSEAALDALLPLLRRGTPVLTPTVEGSSISAAADPGTCRPPGRTATGP